MPRYHLRYLKGPNYTLNLEYDGIVEASSFEEALRPHTDWPITASYDHATATAWNPGTCMYYQEMWEAALLPDPLRWIAPNPFSLTRHRAAGQLP